MNSRRQFLKGAAASGTAAAALTVFPPSIRKALAIPAATRTGTIQDIKHVVILMQENRSFDHYFGTMRGVRGFGDRFPLPLASGKSVWFQSDGTKEIPPYHRDSTISNALLGPGTPHSYSDMQGAWNQGKMDQWIPFKTQYAMGYYERNDIPFQFALAEAFTLCDAYHCSITTGTDPNRIVFWSGSNANPELRKQGINATSADSEPNNSRCWPNPSKWVAGLPQPQATYKYVNTAFHWDTLPDLLQKAGVSWHIYQDMNNNWTGAMHGCLAFESFRTAQPGSPIYEHGLTGGPDFLSKLKTDVINGTLPQVSWILPTAAQSEHPGGGGSPTGGGNFIAAVLDALTANPEVWSQTAFFLTFDENDGFFDHLPAAAVPSYDANGNLMGKSTLPLAGEYFDASVGSWLNAKDTTSGKTRPWGLSARVPMYVVSPWSKGGWVNSQLFDHTSVGMFLEKRFGITVDAISPWHRAVSGDLTTAFDFASPNDPVFPKLPDQSNWATSDAQQRTLPAPTAPATPQPLFQETGVRYARAIPYELHANAKVDAARGTVKLQFANTGRAGAVFHVYDKLHLDRIPKRYTVEAGKTLDDEWAVGTENAGKYDLWVLGPNGFHRHFKGDLNALRANGIAIPEILVSYAARDGELQITLLNEGRRDCRFTLQSNKIYDFVHVQSNGRGRDDDEHDRDDHDQGNGHGKGVWSVKVKGGEREHRKWKLDSSGFWYDFVVTTDADPSFYRRLAGHVETSRPSVTDPGMARADSF